MCRRCCLERRNRIAIRDADNSLRREVHYCVNLIFAKHTFKQRLATHIAIHDLHAIDQARAHEFALRNPVANKTNDVGAGVKQTPHKPAAE